MVLDGLRPEESPWLEEVHGDVIEEGEIERNSKNFQDSLKIQKFFWVLWKTQRNSEGDDERNFILKEGMF